MRVNGGKRRIACGRPWPADGGAVAIEVFFANPAEPATISSEVPTLGNRFVIRRIALLAAAREDRGGRGWTASHIMRTRA